jgi:hypothetical protein
VKPIALGWIDYERSSAPDWHAAQMQRLARKLGYRLVWPADVSVLPLTDQVRNTSAEAVILPAPDHIVPPSVFVDVFAAARHHIDVLVYAAVFLHEAYPRLNDLLIERAGAGCSIRIAVGDADSANVRQRGDEEKFGHGIESRCRLALLHCRPLQATPGIELRTHATTLYNSIFRADEEMLVNAHIWGMNAYRAPVWHLRRTTDGRLFDTYTDSFEAVWQTGRPVEG